MVNKLAGLMSIMAFMLLVLTWLVRTLLGLPVMTPTQILSVALVLMPVFYFFIGRVVARIAIALIQEELSDMRARDEEIVHETRMFKAAAEESAPPPEATPPAPSLGDMLNISAGASEDEQE
jgi:hypothetical protein